jgi:hypothetical protein
MLAEGVLHFFQVQTRESYDRIRRAYGLAVALNTESALPSCAAWMAHFEFNECMYDKMAIHLSEALTRAKPDDHQARARASLVMADAFHLAGRYDLARPWYEETRQRAAAEGDEATLSAMLYNVAAFRAANVRLADTFGLDTTKEAQRAKMETASSVNYDFAIETQGLDFLTKMLQGLILTIQKEYKSAFDIFNNIDKTKIPKRMLGPIHADLAWCCTNLGDLDNGWRLGLIASESLPDISEADDHAYVASRISEIATLCNREEDASTFREIATVSLETHRAFQINLLTQLNSISLS